VSGMKFVPMIFVMEVLHETCRADERLSPKTETPRPEDGPEESLGSDGG